ncbi:hypothetical protein Btru_051075 [Bulinus truncatus]|nr:hypothetical protein Btru_051075 [Bulinus truncatus]
MHGSLTWGPGRASYARIPNVGLFVFLIYFPFLARETTVNHKSVMSTMPLRNLLRYLLNNEQIIQKLADSYPIRRAAQLTAFIFQKGKEIGEERIEKLKETDAINRLQDELKHSSQKVQEQANKSIQKTNSFISTFSKNLSEEWRKAEKKLEQKKKK